MISFRQDCSKLIWLGHGQLLTFGVSPQSESAAVRAREVALEKREAQLARAELMHKEIVMNERNLSKQEFEEVGVMM